MRPLRATHGQISSARSRRFSATCLGIVLAGTLGGCSFSIGGTSGMSAPTLERQLEQEAEDDKDVVLDEVDCATGLNPEVGDKTECEVTVDGVIAVWDVAVTEVEGSTISFEWKVEEGSQRLLVDAATEAIAGPFEDQMGLRLDTMICPDDEIPGIPETEVVCDATTLEGRSGQIRVVVTAASGMSVDFRWEPVDG